MKRIFTILPILTSILLSTSCQKELPEGIGNYVVNKGGQGQTALTPEISIDTNSLEFTAESGSKTFNIKSNTWWTVSMSNMVEWCSVSIKSGNNDGTVTVHVSENTSTSKRSAQITIKAESIVLTLIVSQQGEEFSLSLDMNSLDFSSSGKGRKIVKVTSNTSWKVSCDKSWCHVSTTTTTVYGDGSMTVSVDENTSTSSRTATITVESTTITRTLVVTQSGAEPPASQDRTFTVNGVTFKMIFVEGGTFTMGATSEQGDDAYDREKPAHSVTLSSYSIGETEVTQALWQAVMDSNPSMYSGSNKPVENVSWNDCQNFISKLNILTGQDFRLPTEAEWEYAARGGNQSRGYKYAGSNAINNVAWNSNNSNSETHNVGTLQANELGLYDMSGNVVEWCSDWYGSYSSSSSQTNPTGPSSGSTRVCRGGSGYGGTGYCRVSSRYNNDPNFWSRFLGLRLAL